MHADDVGEGRAVGVEAGAGARPVLRTVVERGGGGERLVGFGDTCRLQIRFAAEDGGEGGGEVAAGVGVVGQAEVHQQRAQVDVAEAERPVVVRVARNGL